MCATTGNFRPFFIIVIIATIIKIRTLLFYDYFTGFKSVIFLAQVKFDKINVSWTCHVGWFIFQDFSFSLILLV